MFYKQNDNMTFSKGANCYFNGHLFAYDVNKFHHHVELHCLYAADNPV